jgi:hypothetical protein
MSKLNELLDLKNLDIVLNALHTDSISLKYKQFCIKASMPEKLWLSARCSSTLKKRALSTSILLSTEHQISPEHRARSSLIIPVVLERYFKFWHFF